MGIQSQCGEQALGILFVVAVTFGGAASWGDELATERLTVDSKMVGTKSGLMEEFIAYTASHPEIQRFSQALYKNQPDCENQSQPDPARTMAEEIGPSLLELIASDEAFKDIYCLPVQSEVHYEDVIPTNARGLNRGHTANFFRNLTKKYGHVEAALMSEEGLRFVRDYYSTKSCY